jgi:radical SAM protein with 4Fe4S-binding SPASM domain
VSEGTPPSRRLKKPLYLSINLNSLVRGKRERLDEEVFEQIRRYIEFDNTLDGLSLNGRDVLSEARVEPLVSLAKQKDCRVSVDLEVVDFLALRAPLHDGITQLRIGIDARSVSEYGDSLDRVLEHLQEIRPNLDCAVTLHSDVRRSWLSCLPEVIEKCRSHGIYLTLTCAHFEAIDSFWKMGEELDALIRNHLDVVSAEHPAWGLRYPTLVGECPGLTTTLHVHSDGSWRVCARDEHPRGWLNRHSVEEAWALLPLAVTKACRSCKDFDACGGGCVVNEGCPGPLAEATDARRVTS